jgi:hypothetical protein
MQSLAVAEHADVGHVHAKLVQLHNKAYADANHEHRVLPMQYLADAGHADAKLGSYTIQECKGMLMQFHAYAEYANAGPCRTRAKPI